MYMEKNLLIIRCSDSVMNFHVWTQCKNTKMPSVSAQLDYDF